MLLIYPAGGDSWGEFDKIFPAAPQSDLRFMMRAPTKQVALTQSGKPTGTVTTSSAPSFQAEPPRASSPKAPLSSRPSWDPASLRNPFSPSSPPEQPQAAPPRRESSEIFNSARGPSSSRRPPREPSPRRPASRSGQTSNAPQPPRQSSSNQNHRRDSDHRAQPALYHPMPSPRSRRSSEHHPGQVPSLAVTPSTPKDDSMAKLAIDIKARDRDSAIALFKERFRIDFHHLLPTVDEPVNFFLHFPTERKAEYDALAAFLHQVGVRFYSYVS